MKKKLDKEQLEIITSALEYGIPIKILRKLVLSGPEAPIMREIVAGMMAGMENEAVEFLCQESFQVYQVREIVQAFLAGLTLEQVKSFASSDISASQMRKLREHLAQKKGGRSGTCSVHETDSGGYGNGSPEIQ